MIFVSSVQYEISPLPSIFGCVPHEAALVGAMRPTNVLGFLQGIPGCVPWSIIGVFMNDYLAVDKGLGVEHATT